MEVQVYGRISQGSIDAICIPPDEELSLEEREYCKNIAILANRQQINVRRR